MIAKGTTTSLGLVLASLLGFIAAATLIILLPGPDTLVVMRSLLRRDRARAARTAAGVVTGLSVWVLVAALGLSAVLRASHDGYLALRVVGGIYLTYLGVQSWRRPAAGDPVESGRGGVLGTGYAAGLATDLLNPKVGVFFVTFLPAFVPGGHSVGLTSLLLGSIFVVMTAMYFVVFLAFASRIMGWLADARLRRRIDRVTGCVLVGFGLRLATESA